MRCWGCAVVLVLLGASVKGVVWDRDQDRGQLKPLEINVEEALQQAKEEQAWSSSFHPNDEQRLLRRQAARGIGFTQALRGDNHRHGLVHWTGYPSEFLFILTRNRVSGQVSESWLWRSTDYGHTFVNDTVKWHNDTVIQWYYIAPLSEYLIFADVVHRVLWVTKDEGESYRNYSVSFSPDDFVFQSQRAPGANSTTLAEYVLSYDDSNNSLWVSPDLGMTWQRLGDNVTNYSWRILNSTYELETTVYFEQAVNDTHSKLYISSYPYNSSHEFDRSLPAFLTGTFVLSNEYMFVQMSGEAGSQDIYSSPLWVSRFRHSFRQARFPLRTQEKHYAVVDTSEGQVFIAVFHDLNSTHLYLSEEQGLNYSLSLNYIISPPESDWITSYPAFDVHVVEGIVGTYVANVKDPSGRFGSTVISYDKGGEWVPLRPPQFDRFGRFINCQQPDCSLHLHIQRSRSNGFQSILTQDSAIGLIMALGNLGGSLTNSGSQLRLYFSRDGGFTWFEVSSGYWQFQFAGQGAIVASIPIRRFTSSVQWSCDEGHNWETVSFLENSTLTSIYVIGMLTEFGERALHVTVFGITSRFTEWLVTDLNFTSVLPNVCTQEDFFAWIPTDERPNGRCVLGESITYERRNASVDTCCYPDPSYNRPVNRTSCPCAQEDFECDFGFQRVSLNSPCTPIPGFLWPPPQPHPCPEGDTYNISSGYRLVALDKCIPGEERTFFPEARPCLVGLPQDFTFTINVSNIVPNQTVGFNLTQHQGAKLFTNYTWNFGVNGSDDVFSSGYEASRYQVFTYTRPGRYAVSLHASSFEGNVDAPDFYVTVLDPLRTLSIIPPIQIVGNEVPAMLDLLFSVTGTTQSGVSLTDSEYTGSLVISWDYGDGTAYTKKVFTDTHRFTSAGNYTVKCIVSSPLGAVSDSRLVSVYEASTHVRISSSSLRQDYYVVVNSSVLLTVLNEDGSGHIIPPMTVFSWTVTSLSEPPCHAPYKMTTSEKNYNLTLPCWGEYAVSVIGNHSLGFFTNNRHIMAEERLTRLALANDIPAVVRNGVYLTVLIQLFSNDQAYEGPVVLNVLSAGNHSQPTSDDSDVYALNVQLNRANLSNPQTVVTFVASNDVSSIQHKVDVTIAVSGNYEALRFLFATTSFPPDHAQEWLDGLVDTLQQQLQTKYLSKLPKASLEVEGRGFVLNESSTSAPVVRSASKSLQSRSNPQELFYVDINLLPESLQDDDIRAIHQVSVQIQQDVDTRQLVVQYSDRSFPVTVENRSSATVIIQPPNTTLYIGLGVGLGAGLILLLVTAIVLGVIIYVYRRQYKSLNVRYSRLRQTPVRFTFTQEGEMVEEDDYEEPSDEDTRGGRQTDSDDDAEIRMRSI